MHCLTSIAFAFFTLFSTGIVSSAVPERRDDNFAAGKQRDHCLTTHEAEFLRDRWIRLNERITDGGTELRNSVTDDVQFLSESYNIVTNVPLNIPTFDGKDALVKGLIAFTSGPTQFNFTVVAGDNGCNSFSFRWSWEFVPGGSTIAGNDLIFVKKGTYLIEKVYSEFNNVLFLKESGCSCAGCQPAKH